MSYLEFSELLHVESNLMMYSAHVSEKSKAFSALISLKNHHTFVQIGLTRVRGDLVST